MLFTFLIRIQVNETSTLSDEPNNIFYSHLSDWQGK